MFFTCQSQMKRVRVCGCPVSFSFSSSSTSVDATWILTTETALCQNSAVIEVIGDLKTRQWRECLVWFIAICLFNTFNVSSSFTCASYITCTSVLETWMLHIYCDSVCLPVIISGHVGVIRTAASDRYQVETRTTMTAFKAAVIFLYKR